VMGAKNSLAVADAEQVERAFQVEHYERGYSILATSIVASKLQKTPSLPPCCRQNCTVLAGAAPDSRPRTR
jgi:hypothetical protein